MRSKRFKIVVESESQAEQRIKLNEEEAINEAIDKKCIVAFY